MTSEIFTVKNPSSHEVFEVGSLAGRRVVVQPNMSVRGWLTDAGSLALEGFVALEDATAVARLKSAGVALVGSTRMSELGFGIAGDTGTLAISTGEADVALITDTMGEARVAASISGLFGFKPSYGIISRFGLIGIVPSMECWGITAKSLDDIIAFIKVIAGDDGKDFSMAGEKIPDFSAIELVEKECTVGVVRECFGTMDDVQATAFQAGLEKVKSRGFTLREVSLEGYDLFRAVHNVVGSVEASSSAGKYDGVRYGHRVTSAKNWNEMYLDSRGESFGTLTKSYLFQGAYFQFENYRAFEDACCVRRRLVREMAGLLEGIDLVAFPARLSARDTRQADTVKGVYDVFAPTLVANVTGQPSLQFPFSSPGSSDGLGLQLVGSYLGDASLLSAGMRLLSLSQGAQRI